MITVRSSSIHRQGVFAKANIPQGTKIIEYTGEKITAKESGRRVDATIDRYKKNGSEGAVYIFELNKKYDIDGNVPYNKARHINHSCSPNAETEIIRGKIWIIALKDIAKAEEITYNYGYDFEDYQDHPCCCGASNCVGYILKEEHWAQLSAIKQGI